MATTTYEEEKKRVDRPADLVMPTYAPPTNTATQQAQAEADAFYNELRQRYAQAADPAVQAAQDARIQRGRQFWTGANLFANVIANAINANGTANGAPNMTWNDASTQKMYETWKDADARLRADRKEAQQRYDAMGLQQQQMRLAAAQAQDRADLEAYKTRFGLENEAAKANWNRQVKEYETQEARDREDAIRKENQAFQEKLARMRRYGGGRTSTKAATDHSVQLGSIDIPAKDDKEAQAIIYQNGGLYDDDTDFRKDINGTYGIEDIYAEEAVPNQVYQMPSYQPRYGQGVYHTPSAAAPASSALASGARRGNGQYQDGGYFIGSRNQSNNSVIRPGQNRAIWSEDENGNTTRLGSVAVEGNTQGGWLGGNQKWDNDKGWVGPGTRPTNGRYEGTQRAPHELTEEEKELIKKNGEKPKINY